MEAMIISAIANLGGSIINLSATNKAAKYDRLPDWLSPKDFQQKDYKMEIIFGVLALVFILLLIAAVFVTIKRK
jgi:hypothetical protein